MYIFCSQILSTGFCRSSASFIQSGPTLKDVSCQHQWPAARRDMLIPRTTRGRTLEHELETEGRLKKTRLSNVSHHQSGQKGPKEEAQRKRSSFTTWPCLAISCIYDCTPTLIWWLPEPPWSGGRSQDASPLSQYKTHTAFTRERCPMWRTHPLPLATVMGW